MFLHSPVGWGVVSIIKKRIFNFFVWGDDKVHLKFENYDRSFYLCNLSESEVRFSRFQIRVYLFYQNWLEACANVEKNVDLCKQMHPCSVIINYFAFLSVTRCSGQSWWAQLLDYYKQRPSSGINASTWLANQELPVLFWNPICITASKRPRHWTISWSSYIHFTLLHAFSLISVLVLSYLLRLGLPSALYSFGSCDSFCVPFLFVPWTLYASSILYSLTNPQNTRTCIYSFCSPL